MLTPRASPSLTSAISEASSSEAGAPGSDSEVGGSEALGGTSSFGCRALRGMGVTLCPVDGLSIRLEANGAVAAASVEMVSGAAGAELPPPESAGCLPFSCRFCSRALPAARFSLSLKRVLASSPFEGALLAALCRARVALAQDRWQWIQI